MNNITNEYWFAEAKHFIQKNIATNNFLNDTVKESLVVLYNSITVENGLELLNNATQIISTMEELIEIEINEITRTVINKLFLEISQLLIIVLIIVCIFEIFHMRYRSSYRNYYHIYESIHDIGTGMCAVICFGLFIYCISLLGLKILIKK